MLKVESVQEQMGMKVFGGQLQAAQLTVGAEARVRRGDQELGSGLVAGVLVGGKMLDQARQGDSIQILLRGPVSSQVQVGDEIEFN
jgi:translation elongation factor EF-Tu-like GTPase